MHTGAPLSEKYWWASNNLEDSKEGLEITLKSHAKNLLAFNRAFNRNRNILGGTSESV